MLFENRTVTDRVLLLGLDHLYRARMKHHESSELLACAREVADALATPPSRGPVEGYYTESHELEAYFRLMRALQNADRHLSAGIADLASYRRLLEVTSSPIFGTPVGEDRLLPRSRDSLFAALAGTPVSEWALDRLMTTAVEKAVSSDDCSLVGLAVLSRDAVVVTALRETVVLYVLPVPGAALRSRKPRYRWRVGEEVARRAEVFVDRFNSLFDDQLPKPHPDNAARFWSAHNEETVDGRCVLIGFDDSTKPTRNYHWAVRESRRKGRPRYWSEPEYEAHDFWDARLWTTQTYRSDPKSPRWH